MRHKCIAGGCRQIVEERFLMCATHWMIVPRELQTDIWREFHRGQDRGTHPTDAYTAAVRKAIGIVAADGRKAAA